MVYLSSCHTFWNTWRGARSPTSRSIRRPGTGAQNHRADVGALWSPGKIPLCSCQSPSLAPSPFAHSSCEATQDFSGFRICRMSQEYTRRRETKTVLLFWRRTTQLPMFDMETTQWLSLDSLELFQHRRKNVGPVTEKTKFKGEITGERDQNFPN